MADRQRAFLMAANHFRAGRITIDEFREKVFASAAGQVAVLTGPDGESEAVKAAIAQIEKAGATAVQLQMPSANDPAIPEGGQKKLRSAGAVVMIGLADLDSIYSVAREAGGPMFVVPDENCDLNNLTAIAQDLPAGVALLGKGQVASAAKIAASLQVGY